MVEDGDDIKPVFIDDCVAEADDSLIVKEPFVMEPHCSIEICDLERCDTQLIRWKMVGIDFRFRFLEVLFAQKKFGQWFKKTLRWDIRIVFPQN